jgi:hypothetical protein
MLVTTNSGVLRNMSERILEDDEVVLGPQRDNITIQLRNSSNSLGPDNKVTTLPISSILMEAFTSGLTNHPS